MSKPNYRSMKLLVDKSQRKVLYAEACKDCVDLLFHILSLPLGSVVGSFSKEPMPGSIHNLYISLEGLRPKSATGSASNAPLLATKPAVANPATMKFYTCNCNYYHACISDGPGGTCPCCRSQMNTVATYVASPHVAAKNTGGGGYVKGVTYMIMDDLSVQPMSTMGSLALLKKLNIQDMGLIEEKTVYLDMNMGLTLLKGSLTSKTVLTDTFLLKRPASVSDSILFKIEAN